MTLEERKALLETLCRELMAKPLTFTPISGGGVTTPAIPAQVIQLPTRKRQRRVPLQPKVIPLRKPK